MQSLLLLLALFFSLNVFGSFPEYFGTGPSTAAIGNQANWDAHDAANVYYIPALAGFAKRPSISLSTTLVSPSIDPISNIVTSNSTTGESGTTTQTGSANTNYESSLHGPFSAVIPVLGEGMGALGIAFFSELGSLAESNSGDPNLPEYVMLRSRYKRTQLFLNYAYPFSDQWSFSVGAHLGFQVAATADTTLSLSDSQSSKANAKAEVDPSLAAVLSVARRDKYSIIYGTFQQEMKSNLSTTLTGEVVDPSLNLVNISLSGLIYYDPHILRFGYVNRFDFFDLYLSAEYQMWDNYRSPKLVIANTGGSVRSSQDFETLTLRNVLVPRIGVGFDVMEQTVLNVGLAYRQTPLDGDFSGSGNSIDTNSVILSGGVEYKFKLFNKDMNLGFSAQYHQLQEKTVTKTSGQENGNSGSKIGAPGFKIGGSITAISTGIKIKF